MKKLMREFVQLRVWRMPMSIERDKAMSELRRGIVIWGSCRKQLVRKLTFSVFNKK
jgi:hypothetical protein